MSALPGVPNVGVFDTAFHATMPPESHMYALLTKWYEKYQDSPPLRLPWHLATAMFRTGGGDARHSGR